MRFRTGSTLGLALLALLTIGPAKAAASGDGEKQSHELGFKAHEKWSFVLPRETWKSVGTSIDLDGGRSFGAAKTGQAKVEIDTDGDGELDTKVKGVKGFLTLTKDLRGNKKQKYAVRLRNTGRSWEWSSSGFMQGSVRGKQIRLIDQDGNGRFNDLGKDAILIGKSKAASYLGRTVNIGGSLYDISVSEDGSELSSEPFIGDTARIDVTRNWDGNGKLAAAVFVDKNKTVSFNAAEAKKGGLLVPAGEYRFASGYAEKGGESVMIRGGRMRPVQLAADSTHEVNWGGPVTMEFAYRQKGEKITVSADLKFFGNAGEEYHSFQPNAKSPKILISDRESGKLVQSGRFGGC